MNLDLMKSLCDTPKEKLKKYLIKYLKTIDYKPCIREDYIFAEGDIPVCLIAHIDTVFDGLPLYYLEEGTKESWKWLYDQKRNILWKAYGAGFDDRAGIYSILKVLGANYRPHIIFTDNEEIGGLGAQQLIADFPQCPFNSCNFLIQLDRRGLKDAVFYQCRNKKFMRYITSFDFEVSVGTFTDISFIAPTWNVGAVNLSCGYVDEHSESERLYCDICDATIEKVKMILDDNKEKQHKFTY